LSETNTKFNKSNRQQKSDEFTLQNLVSAHYTAGRLQEAEIEQYRAIKGRIARWGETAPGTIRAMEFGVMLRLEQCKWDGAQLGQTEVLRLQRDTLGTEHPRAVEAAAASAAIYSEQENWDKAEGLQLEILEQKRRVLGKDHLEAIRAAANLASTYHVQGRWNEARQLWLEVLEGRKRILGEDHPNTVLAAEGLDASLRAPKEVEKARRWKLDLTGALEGAANCSMDAMVDAKSDSSYPHAS
jgi:tetratricopeptide (TPR) repeat protein